MIISTNLFKIVRNIFTSTTIYKIITFTTLFCLAGLAGKISIPGTAVGITMQTFVLMLASLHLSTAEGTASIISYITLGAMGLPVFSGGISTAALIGPSAGFIWGFIPAFWISRTLITLTRTHIHNRIGKLTLTLISLIAGCIAALYLIGVSIQSILVHTSWTSLMYASFGFITFDLIKAIIALSTIFIPLFKKKA